MSDKPSVHARPRVACGREVSAGGAAPLRRRAFLQRLRILSLAHQYPMCLCSRGLTSRLFRNRRALNSLGPCRTRPASSRSAVEA